MSAATADEHIHADDTADRGSILSDDRSYLTQSLQSSILDGIKENGRSYHRYQGSNGGDYPIPEDETEQQRLELQHQLFSMTFHGRLCLSPIDSTKVREVLDLGTGTGTWAIEFADENPNANVTGTDLSPMQPSYIPSNLKFEIDDFNNDWTFPQKFDFIHARGLTGASGDFKALTQKCYDQLSPGGYLEMSDVYMPFMCDDDSYTGTALETWTTRQVKACAKFGADTTGCSKYKQWMTEIGFEDVQEHMFKWPVGTWPKDKELKKLGKLTMINFLVGIEGFTMRLWTTAFGMQVDEVNNYLDKVRHDIQNPRIHSYWPVYAVYGRKPVVLTESNLAVVRSMS